MSTNLTRRSFLRAAGSFTAVGGITYFFPGLAIAAQAEKSTPPSEQTAAPKLPRLHVMS